MSSTWYGSQPGEDPPAAGKTVRAGDLTAVCTKVEWRYVPHTPDEPVECQPPGEQGARDVGGHQRDQVRGY